MLLLVTYDIKSPDKDYIPLYESIKNSSKSWWHYMESIWIVKTELSPNEFFDRIKECLDTNDRCMVINITNCERQGWLPSKAWEWIKYNDK